MKVMIFPHVTIIGVYRLLAVPVQQLCYAINEVLSLSCSQFIIFIGDFNINWLDKVIEVLFTIYLLIVIITGK